MEMAPTGPMFHLSKMLCETSTYKLTIGWNLKWFKVAENFSKALYILKHC